MIYVLTALKILGIVLLVIVGLLLLAVLLLLLVPIRYRVDADIRRQKEETGVYARVSWLLRLISLDVRREQEDFTAVLRIVFLRRKLYPREYLPSGEKAKQAAEDTAEKTAEALYGDEREGTGQGGEEDCEDAADIPPEQPPEGSADETAEAKQRASSGKRRAKTGRKMRIDLGKKLHNMTERIRHIRERIDEFRGFLSDASNQQALSHIGRVLLRLLKRIRPRRLRLSALFSAGKPDLTGELLGVLAMFPVWYRNRWQITPDFESDEAYLDGELSAAGHIRLVHFTAAAVKLVLDARCRRLYRKGRNLF